jgi:hypothetical protein
MALTVLQIVQSACKRIGIIVPNAAVSAVDQQTIQLVGLCEEEGQEQAARYAWTALQTEATFLTTATETQTLLETAAPGCKYIVNDTIWNRDLRRPVYGPKSQQDWQQAKAININGPFNSFRVIQGNILFNPIPVAGQNCYFEYVTRYWISTSVGAGAQFWTNDADLSLLDDACMITGLIWRWKQAKGQAYAEDYAKYERLITDAMARDGSKPKLNLGGQSQYEIQPVVAVPTGSFGQ